MSLDFVAAGLAEPETERALLGSILIDPAVMVDVYELIQPGDFWQQTNGLIYQAMVDLWDHSQAIDLTTLPGALRRHTPLDEIGDAHERGEVYLIGLLTACPTHLHAETYARRVVELARRRQVGNIARKIADLALDLDVDPAELDDRVFSAVLSMRTDGPRKARELGKAAEAFESVLEERIEEPGLAGLPTGYRDLDLMIRGLKKQDLVIIGGRPGMGKTALALGMAFELAAAGHRGLLLSMEMSEEQLLARICARQLRQCGVEDLSTQDLLIGRVQDQHLAALWEILAQLRENRYLVIDDTPALSPGAIKAQALRTKAMLGGLDYVIVDYLQLVEIPGERDRYQEVSKVARFLKNLAKELDIPIIAVSQLSRKVEDRTDKRPGLADLRESGEIEQAADVVIMLYRESYYKEDLPEERANTAEAIFAKQRNGPTGTVFLYWSGKTASYHDLARQARTEELNL